MALSDTMDAVSSFFRRGSRYTPLPTNALTEQPEGETRYRRRRRVKLAAGVLILVVVSYLATASL